MEYLHAGALPLIYESNDATKQKRLECVRQFKVCNTKLLQTKCPAYLTKDQWTPNSPTYNPWLYHGWGQCQRLSQASSKAKGDRQTPGNAADDLGQLTQGPIHKEVSK